MRLTDLAAAVRKSGLPVVEVPGWQTRGHAAFTRVASIICHHTAGPRSGNMPSLTVVTYGRAGLPGPLCNLGLGRDGTVYVVAAGVAWHAGKADHPNHGNYRAIGIEAEATGVDSWPEVQMDAYARLCRALCDHYGVPVAEVRGHKEIAVPRGRKIDPNFDMDAFRRRVADTTTEEALIVNDKDEQRIRQIFREELAAHRAEEKARYRVGTDRHKYEVSLLKRLLNRKD